MTSVTLETKALPIHSDPDILGGTTVFRGTRVPARTLFDYLEDGCPLDEFLAQFPTVKRKDAITLLEAASDTLRQGLSAHAIPASELRNSLNEGGTKLG